MKNKILNILIILNIFFIFFMSSKTPSESLDNSSSFIITFLGKPFDGKLLSFLLTYLSEDNLMLIVRKCAHFSEYFLLGFLLSLRFKINPLYLIIFCNIIANYDELYQGIFNRSSSIFDTLIDTSGSLLAISIVFIFYNIKKHRKVL